jgi:uncharacterized membrane protein YgdD (TMEM256/DUF423 family)
MNFNSDLQAKLAAFLGLTGVALGAFGAHMLKATLITNQSVETWKTATLYHLTHAILLFVLAHLFPQRKITFYLFFFGVIFFSGSLYLLSLDSSMSWLGPITPLGGLLLLSGWVSLFKSSSHSS